MGLPSVDDEVGVAGDPPRVGVRIDATGLERRDLGQIQHVADVEPRARGLDPAEAVDREVAERVRRRERRERERRGRESKEHEPPHRRAFLATGDHKTEKCGLSASARCRNASPAARLPRQRSIIPRWKSLSASRRAEPERAPRVGERLATAAVPGERPGEHVVAVDARALGAGAAGQRQRVREPDAVVDVEERGLEVGLDAVRDEEPLDHADQRVLAAGELRSPCAAVEIAQLADVLRQRNQGGSPLLQRDRALRAGLVPPPRGPARPARTGNRGRRGARFGTRPRRRSACRPTSRSCRAAPASRPPLRPGRCRRRPRASSPRSLPARRRAARARGRRGRRTRGPGEAPRTGRRRGRLRDSVRARPGRRRSRRSCGRWSARSRGHGGRARSASRNRCRESASEPRPLVARRSFGWRASACPSTPSDLL